MISSDIYIFLLKLKLKFSILHFIRFIRFIRTCEYLRTNGWTGGHTDKQAYSYNNGRTHRQTDLHS